VTSIVAAFALTAEMVATATGGQLVAGRAERTFETVSIDSRTIGPGALFIALRGDHFDGHDFIDGVVAKGAAGLLVSRPRESFSPKTTPEVVILVGDTLRALQELGRFVRRQSGARVVAITCSAGKTTTKEVIADFLSERFRVFRNVGNLNNHIGLPLSLIELRHGADVGVVELGMNHTGEIRTLVSLAQPDVRVWINVGDAHLGHFDSRDALASAKAEILEDLAPDTLVVANADDAFVMQHVASASPARLVTFGESAAANVRATNVVDRGFDGTTADVRTPKGDVTIHVPLPGRAHLMNVLAATAVAAELGVSLDAIQSHAAKLQPVARRGRSLTTNGVRVVDDSYNASPAAVRAMIAALASTKASGRRLAVLGEMLELGTNAHALHANCGAAAASAHVDELVAVGGPAADGFIEGARAAGMDASHLHRFADSRAAAPALARLVQPGDVVLIKGSRGTRMDVIADALASGGAR